MIKVKNIRGYLPHPSETPIYIGRPGYKHRYTDMSILGNPFTVSQYGRDGCIQKYKVYLRDKIKSGDTNVISSLRQLTDAAKAGDVVLLCWCKPSACHGDYIKEIVERKLKKEFK